MRSILCEGSASASSSSLLISPSLSSNTSLRHHQGFRKRTRFIKRSRRTRAGHMCLRQSPLAHPTIPMAYLELYTLQFIDRTSKPTCKAPPTHFRGTTMRLRCMPLTRTQHETRRGCATGALRPASGVDGAAGVSAETLPKRNTSPGEDGGMFVCCIRRATRNPELPIYLCHDPPNTHRACHPCFRTRR